MLSFKIDKFLLGDLAEECGLQIKTGPDPYGRDTHVEISLEILAGKGRFELRSIAAKRDAVIPPIGAAI